MKKLLLLALAAIGIVACHKRNLGLMRTSLEGSRRLFFVLCIHADGDRAVIDKGD